MTLTLVSYDTPGPCIANLSSTPLFAVLCMRLQCADTGFFVQSFYLHLLHADPGRVHVLPV
jgi:hypothetical protein